MNKQETIKYLTDLMATVQMAYFKGRETGVRVHECPDQDSAAISVDLYHFEGDGQPVADGLVPCTVTFDDGSTMTGSVFCMTFDPDDEDQPLVFQFDSGVIHDMDADPDALPEQVLRDVAAWLEKEMPPKPVVMKENPATSLFFYMWNAWCEEECRKVYGKDDFWPHFWNKWCAINKQYGRYGAVEHFYADLSNDNRDKLVARAMELYDKSREKY